jgi:hypothetical protein
MSFWFPYAAAFVLLLGLFAHTWWRNTVIRKSMSLNDDIVRLLTRREIIWLRRGLTEYLKTPEGLTLADDPRVVSRLALFEACLQQSRDRATRARRARALRAAGLPELPEMERAA